MSNQIRAGKRVIHKESVLGKILYAGRDSVWVMMNNTAPAATMPCYESISFDAVKIMLMDRSVFEDEFRILKDEDYFKLIIKHPEMKIEIKSDR